MKNQIPSFCEKIDSTIDMHRNSSVGVKCYTSRAVLNYSVGYFSTSVEKKTKLGIYTQHIRTPAMLKRKRIGCSTTVD